MKRAEKKATGGANGQPHTEDISHELVETATAEKSLTPVIETVDDQIKHEIAKFNFPEAAIAQLKETYGSLVITGPEDKVGYEAVKKAWGDVRSKRTGLEKKGLDLRNNFTVITKAIKTEEVRLIELLSPLETDLHGKWKAIDDEKERKKKEQEEAEGRRLMERIQELQQIGMSFKDGFYQIGDTITVDVASLRAMTDETYKKLKVAAGKKAEEIQKAQEEEKQRKLQEQQQLQQQQEELRKQQEILKQQQEEMQRQQDELKKHQQEAARMKLEIRASKFTNWGFETKGSQFVYDNGFESVRVDHAQVESEPDATFDALVAQKIQEVKDADQRKIEHDRQVEEEKQAKEKKQKLIAEKLEEAGLRYNWKTEEFEFKNDFYTIAAKWPELMLYSEEDLSTLAGNYKAKIDKAKLDQTKAEQKKIEDEEKAKKLQLNDKQRWDREIQQMTAQAGRIVPAEYKTEKFKTKAQNFLDRLNNLINEFKP